jgi:hypothetical protein
MSTEFDTAADETDLTVGLRLGHDGSYAIGTAWFTELSLMEIGKARK